jgi:chlorophyllide a reductase subunit Z
MDKAEATPARAHAQITWDAAANDELEAYIAKHSVLTRISAAKRLRDHAELLAGQEGAGRVTVETVRRSRAELENSRAA